MNIKKLSATISAALVLSLSTTPLISSAAPEEPTTVSSAQTTVSDIISNNSSSEPTTEPDWQKIKDDYQEEILERVEEQKENEKKTPNDYYNDPYYDTDGNAELIDSKAYKVIYSSTELLFTAVTTKDGHVFYIIINYADEDGKDNVYFLNKVDDFDLYSLLNNGNNNSSSNSSSSSNNNESKKNTAEEYLAQKGTTPASNDSDVTTTQANKTNAGGSKLKLILLLGLVIAIGAAGWIIPKIMNRPKKNNVEFEDDDLEEVNEDEM
jgi:hypothetical protein